MKLKIESLNDHGLGVGIHDGQPVTVPYTAPGDEIEIQLSDDVKSNNEGILKSITMPSLQRIIPPCPYFAQCGGCQLQHLNVKAYQQFKHQQIQDALIQENVIFPDISSFYKVDPGTRRRVTFKYQKIKTKLEIGFFKRKSHTLIPITACLLVFPKINELIIPLKKLLVFLFQKSNNIVKGEVIITVTDSGLDIILTVPLSTISPHQYQDLMDFSQHQTLARLSLQYTNNSIETIYKGKEPYLNIQNIKIPTMENGFLQASPQGEQALITLIENALKGKSQLKILELFAGIGTFSIPLTQFGTVDSYEGDPRPISILKNVALRHQLPLKTYVCDLFKSPLPATILDQYDIIVIDPPRLGAIHQVKEMVHLKKVQKIIYISCHAKTFARDSRFLQNQGWQLTQLNIVDQFLWSYHTEIFSIWEKI